MELSRVIATAAWLSWCAAPCFAGPVPPREVGKVAAVANLTASGAIGAAALVTDVRVITIAQTTAGLTFTLPNPSDTSVITALDVVNTGSASFTMYGVVLAPSSLLHVAWSGSAWIADGASGAPAKALQAGNSAATAGTTATFTFTWATAFTASPAVTLGVFSGGATAPQVTICQADTISTTQVTGHCSSTQTTGIVVGGNAVPVIAATGVVVSVAGIGRTQ